MKQIDRIKQMNATEISDVIEDIPTIEQKHGHFVQNEFISTLGMCSVCEHPIDDGDNFCKWCGAKMDGDSE